MFNHKRVDKNTTQSLLFQIILLKNFAQARLHIATSFLSFITSMLRVDRFQKLFHVFLFKFPN
jgi:hypothetical protein